MTLLLICGTTEPCPSIFSITSDKLVLETVVQLEMELLMERGWDCNKQKLARAVVSEAELAASLLALAYDLSEGARRDR